MWDGVGFSECGHRHGFVLRLQGDWLTVDKRCAIEDKVLLNFVMKVYETQLAQGCHFLHEHLEHAPTWKSPRTRALRQHPSCGVIPGD